MNNSIHPDLSVMCSLCWKHAKNDTCTEKSCCLAGLYNKNPNPTVKDIVKYCCIDRCHHGKEYHDRFCPINLAKVNTYYYKDDHVKLKQFCTLYCGKIQADFCEEKNLSICPIALKNWQEKI